ncbi:hypothetical protein BaRGS_00031195 [Batillaria attramentaria]|uniref:Ig-like domain-containing protein n=1 Tax=Batillaria attramentaria TaxID=370345 RepID=A0ABD0JS48_9CAEN
MWGHHDSHYGGFVLVLTAVLHVCTGLRLQPCRSGVVEVLEGSNSFSFTCDQYSNAITWYYKTRRSLEQIIGTCDATACQATGIPPGLFSLTFLTASSSRVNLTNQVTERRYGITYRCADSQTTDRCQVDIVSHAVLPPAGASVTEARWALQGTSDVTSVFSSLGRYSCQWREADQSGQVISAIEGVLTLSPVISDSSNTQNRTGTCTLSKSLPTLDGNYTYSVVVSPGQTVRVGGAVHIVRPVTPRVTCSPSPWVPENTDVICTCSTQSVGRPEGRLRWFRGKINTINSGNYGDTRLTLTSQRMTRADHNVTTFRCDVEWAESITEESYTAQVGYAVSPPIFTVTSSTVRENQSVAFTCRADGRPTPNITLVNRDTGRQLRRQSSPLSYSVSRARCEDAGVYTCSASNGIGPDQVETIKFLVNCEPRTQEGQSDPARLPALTFMGDSETLMFSTIAYPTPASFNLTFLGSTYTSNTPSVIAADIDAVVFCRQSPTQVHIASCYVVVFNVTSASAAGYYRVTLANDQGEGNFVFQIRLSDTEGEISESGTDQSSVSLAPIAALSAVLVALLLAIVILTVWLWRRGWVLPCVSPDGTSSPSVSRRLSKETPAADYYLTPVSGRRDTVPRFAAPTGPYDSLQMDDVNVRSPYAEIGHHDNQPPHASRGAEPAYSNTRPQEETNDNSSSYLELV